MSSHAEIKSLGFSAPLPFRINEILNEFDILLCDLLPHNIRDIDIGVLLPREEVEHQLAVFAHRVTLLARVGPCLAQGLLAAPQSRVVRPFGLLAVLVARCLREGPGQAAAAGRLRLLVLGRKSRGVDAGQLGREVRVLFEEPR